MKGQWEGVKRWRGWSLRYGPMGKGWGERGRGHRKVGQSEEEKAAEGGGANGQWEGTKEGEEPMRGCNSSRGRGQWMKGQ